MCVLAIHNVQRALGFADNVKCVRLSLQSVQCVRGPCVCPVAASASDAFDVIDVLRDALDVADASADAFDVVTASGDAMDVMAAP